MSQLQDNLDEILRQKNAYLLPENIKKDVTVLNVTGTYEGGGSGSGDVKLFGTETDMNADTSKQENDLALVYRYIVETQPIDYEEDFDSCIFPNTVILDEPVTSNATCTFSGMGSGQTYRLFISSRSVKFGKGTTVIVNYVSSDGITYTRTDGGEELIEFGDILMYMSGWKNVMGNFMVDIYKDIYFGGLYKCVLNENNALQYTLADVGLDTASEYVYNQKTYYSNNGNIQGTLPDISKITNTFSDFNANIYAQIQSVYDDMTPIVWTDSNKPLEDDIYAIPVKSDGIILLDTSAVTDMTRAFMGKTLYSVPKIDTSNVTNMYRMFTNCFNLKHIALLDTSNVTNMESAFGRCGLETIPLFDTSNVTNMNSTFNGCKVVNMPVLDTSSVITMSFIFGGCSHLSNDSLNNILQMCINAVNYTGQKLLKYIGLTQEQATTCQSLSNWSAFVAAGWSTGY